MLPVYPDEAAAKRRLAELQALYPLPAGCALADSLLDWAQVGELELGMVGLVAQLPGELSATGAAADSGGGLPVDRAFFELLERSAILLVPARADALALRDRTGRVLGSRPAAGIFPPEPAGASLRASRSSGVALHTSWPAACAAAQRELIERDHVLRSFHGEFAPRRCEFGADAFARALRAQYSLEAYAIDPAPPLSAAEVRGVFLFPRTPEAPLAYGFAAADSGEEALRAAASEALQRLAFLWGEALPIRAPDPAPTPDYHQEYYLYPPHHAQLRAWLSGTHGASTPPEPNGYAGEHTTFIDLTPEALSGRLAIARATSPHACVLRFGAEALPPHPVV